jgi:hypothetical protein
MPGALTGNGWPCIWITPEAPALFQRLLTHLSLTYDVPPPRITSHLDGMFCDFRLLGVDATLDIDNWTFSMAFAEEATRDRVLADLRLLPEHYFDD